MSNPLYAEELGHYWKTGERRSSDDWLALIEALIAEVGGVILQSAYGKEPQVDRAAYMLTFRVGEDVFRIVQLVLQTRTKKPADEKAARIQAVTLMYHDVKARIMQIKIKGARRVFFEYLLLPDGRVAGDVGTEELMSKVPAFLSSNIRPLALPPGDE